MGNWALLMVGAAHVLQLATSERDWQSFVVTTTALIDGEALEGIPVMQHILDTSAAAWEEENPIWTVAPRRRTGSSRTRSGTRPFRDWYFVVASYGAG